MSMVSPANQYTSDAREQKCWDLYVESLRIGMPNASKAAREAGYEDATAKNIMVRDWFVDRLAKLRLSGMRAKAERNLDRMLDTGWENGKEGAIQPEVMRIVADVSKTVAKALGKDDWAERQELTGKGGKDLPTPILGNIMGDNAQKT